MHTIIVQRHGTPRSRFGDESLTAEGRRQIEEKSKIITGIITGYRVCLHASPLRRTVESAEIVSAQTGLQLFIDHHLVHEVMGIDEAERFLNPIRDTNDIIVLVGQEVHITAMLILFAEEYYSNNQETMNMPFAATVVIDVRTGRVRLL